MSYKHAPLVTEVSEDPEPNAQEISSYSHVQQSSKVSWWKARGALVLLAAACALVLMRYHPADSEMRGGAEGAIIGLASSSPEPKIPCQCESDTTSWKKKERPEGSKPKCIYFALGANDGDMYRTFLDQSAPGTAEHLGNFARLQEVNSLKSWKRHSILRRAWDGCVSSVRNFLGMKDVIFHTGPDHSDAGECEAYLIEMNEAWSDELDEIVEESKKQRPDTQVEAIVPSAVFMCEGTTTFEVDTASTESIATSMGSQKEEEQHINFKKKRVSVQTVNLLRMLYEKTTPEDFVIVDMDIEGAEFDILPCLAKSPAGGLIDELYMEVHYSRWSLTHPSTKEMSTAVATLHDKGVIFPDYSAGVKV